MPHRRSVAQHSPTIDELLEKNRHFDAQFGGGLSNHLSMALVALARLGATDARLGQFFAAYSKQLEPRPVERTPITRETFTKNLGTHHRYGDYLAFFADELHRNGRTQLLATYLPNLVPGISGAAFHAMIRLAYGLEIDDDAEVAASLAYLADAYLMLGAPTGDAPIDEPPAELLRRLAAMPALAHRTWRSGLITNAFEDIAKQPSFAGVIDWLPASAAELAQLAEAALLVYASSDDFVALHGLTSTHALRVAWPHFSAPAVAARFQFQALCAVYAAIGTPPLLSPADASALARRDVPAWPEIAATAVRSNDEHVIKLVYSAREEAAVYGHPLYRYVAAKKAGLVS